MFEAGRLYILSVAISAVMIYSVCMIQETHAEKERGTNVPPKPILPIWIMDRSASETRGSKVSNDPETAGFASGSALALLHVTLNDPNINVPTELLRNRLALPAAAHCLKLEGRVQTEADIRDAYLLTAAGDATGPAGDMLALWRTGSSLRLSSVAGSGTSVQHRPSPETGWCQRLVSLLPLEMQEHVSNWMEQAEDEPGSPIAKAASLLRNIVQLFPRQEAVALLCADVILARSLGWNAPLPLFGLHLKGKALRAASDGEDIRIACHEAVAHASKDAVRLAHDLARRTGRLRVIAPKLRSKGSDEAINLFLSEDAILPSTMLSPTIRGSSTTMTPRSARRFCERLIELGVVRELTGRASFRLYGVSA